MSNSSINKLFQLRPSDEHSFDELFQRSASIGASAHGGLNRQTGSIADGKMRDEFCRWLKQHGFEVKIDAIGNIFGCMQFDPSLDYILCGSHLDTQPQGGKYDGVYGVIAAAVAIHALAELFKQHQIKPHFNLAVVSWTNEEGARFQPSLTGSSVFTKKLTLEQALACVDNQGISLQQALAEIGYLGDQKLDSPIHGYYELHVEQGHVLESKHKTIGIVDATWAALKLKISFHGEQNHTGPALMQVRKDALLAAAHSIVAVRKYADLHPNEVHSSVGKIDCHPNSPNIVPDQVEIYVEFRSANEALLLNIRKYFFQDLQQINQHSQCTHRILTEEFRTAVQLDPQLTEQNQAIATSLGYSNQRMKTIAGHDAIRISQSLPASLIFVPSHHGLSHNEQEFTAKEDLYAGLNLLIAILGHQASNPSARQPS